MGAAATGPDRHVAGCGCALCWWQREERASTTVRVLYWPIGAAYVVTAALSDPTAAAASCQFFAFALFAVVVRLLGNQVELRNPHRSPRPGAARRTVVAVSTVGAAALGVLLLFAGHRLFIGRPLVAFLDRLFAAADAMAVLVGLAVTLLFAAGAGLALLVSAFATAVRRSTGRPVAADAPGWKHGVGGAALLVGVAVFVQWLVEDWPWLREQWAPLLDLLD